MSNFAAANRPCIRMISWSILALSGVTSMSLLAQSSLSVAEYFDRIEHYELVLSSSDWLETESEASAQSIDRHNEALSDIEFEAQSLGGDISSVSSPAESCDQNDDLYKCTQESDVSWWEPDNNLGIESLVNVDEKLGPILRNKYISLYPTETWYENGVPHSRHAAGSQTTDMSIIQPDNDWDVKILYDDIVSNISIYEDDIENCGAAYTTTFDFRYEVTEGYTATLSNSVTSSNKIEGKVSIKLGSFGNIGGGVTRTVSITDRVSETQNYISKYTHARKFNFSIPSNIKQSISLTSITGSERWEFTGEVTVVGSVRPYFQVYRNGQLARHDFGEWQPLEELLTETERSFEVVGYLDNIQRTKVIQRTVPDPSFSCEQ